MPQVTPRLPNSSSGGAPPQHKIAPATLALVLPLIGRPLQDGELASLKSDLEKVLSEYLLLAGAALSVAILDRRKDRFSEVEQALRNVVRLMEALQVGDEGDFYTAYIERHLSHPLLDVGCEGKLIMFRDRMREDTALMRAVAIACGKGKETAFGASQAGLQPRKIWRIMVRAVARVWTRHGLSDAVRHDGDPRGSDLVNLIHILQMSLPERFRHHEGHPTALLSAVSRALNESPASVDFT